MRTEQEKGIIEEALGEIKALTDELSSVGAELNSVLSLIKDEKILTSKDVAEKMGISESAAREYMNRKDFPRLNAGKGYRVSSVALFLYNLKQRI